MPHVPTGFVIRDAGVTVADMTQAPHPPPPPTPTTPAATLDYRGAPTGGELRETHGVARWAWWLLIGYAGLALLMQLGEIAQGVATVRAFGGGGGAAAGGTPDLVWLGVSVVMGLAGLVGFGVFVGMVVAYMIWQYRTAANLAALGRPTRFGAGMGVGWWFIPVANLVMPLLVTRDLADRAGARGAVGTATGSWACAVSGLLIGIVGGALAQVRMFRGGAFGAGNPAAVYEVMFTWDYFATVAVSTLLWSAGFVLLARFVGAVQGRQPEAA